MKNNNITTLGMYLDFCKNQKRLNPNTLRAYRIDILQFSSFITPKSFPETDKLALENYIKMLHNRYSPRSAKRKIASIKAFFHYLEYCNVITTNPWAGIYSKFREPKTLPHTISQNNIHRLLAIIYSEIDNGKTKYRQRNAIRDAAVCELLFATGLRIFELCSLLSDDVDLTNDSVFIRGKGAKERILHIGNTQVHDTLVSYKSEFSKEISECGRFFVNQHGNPFLDQSVRRMINYYTKLAGLDQHITPHMWRHTFATLLLEADVDIRYIQEMLGHSSIRTTEIYTHVSLAKQREILCAKHPRNTFFI